VREGDKEWGRGGEVECVWGVEGIKSLFVDFLLLFLSRLAYLSPPTWLHATQLCGGPPCFPIP